MDRPEAVCPVMTICPTPESGVGYSLFLSVNQYSISDFDCQSVFTVFFKAALDK